MSRGVEISATRRCLLRAPFNSRVMRSSLTRSRFAASENRLSCRFFQRPRRALHGCPQFVASIGENLNAADLMWLIGSIEVLSGVATGARGRDSAGKQEPDFYGEFFEPGFKRAHNTNYHQQEEHKLHDGLAGLIHEKGANALHLLDGNARLSFLTTRLRVGKWE
jgi:hypothetical protein